MATRLNPPLSILKKPLVRNRRNQLYGNEHGLPGLPRTTYVSVGNRRVPPRTQMRPPGPISTRTGLYPSGSDHGQARRIDYVEQRISSMELSNRTLLDELMRLQQEIKANVRRNELAIQEERDARNRMEMGIRQSQGRNFESDDRMRRCEEGVKDNRGALQQVTSHLSSIEKLVMSLQQDVVSKRSEHNPPGQDHRMENARLAQDIDHLERLLKNTQEDGKVNSNRIDSLHKELGILSNNIRLQSKLMEENSRKMVPLTPGIDKRIVDNERANTEVKIMQLNSVIQELSARLTDETKRRERLEYELNNKLHHVIGDIDSSKTARDKSQKEYDDKMNEVRAGFTETDKRQLHMQISGISNDLNKKIDTNNERLRQDTVDKLEVIEKTLKEEHKKREKKDAEIDKKLEQIAKDAKPSDEDGNTKLKTAFEQLKTGNKDHLRQLNQRLEDVEKVVQEHQKNTERLLTAEIQERLNNDRVLDSKIDDLEDDVQEGFQSIQNYVLKNNDGPKNSKKSPTAPPSRGGIGYDEMSKLHAENADGIRQQVAKDIGRLESRVAALETETKQINDMLEDERVETAQSKGRDTTTLLGDNLQQQIDAVAFKQTKLKKDVDDLGTIVHDTPKNLQAHKDEMSEVVNDMTEALNREKKERQDDVKEIIDNMTKIVGKSEQGDIPSLAQLNLDVDQAQTGLKKCAESLHVVKTMLTEKMRDEKKIRDKEHAILTSDVERLDTKIKDIKEKIKSMSSGSRMDDDDVL